jgi:hypothetical protein
MLECKAHALDAQIAALVRHVKAPNPNSKRSAIAAHCFPQFPMVWAFAERLKINQMSHHNVLLKHTTSFLVPQSDIFRRWHVVFIPFGSQVVTCAPTNSRH